MLKVFVLALSALLSHDLHVQAIDPMGDIDLRNRSLSLPRWEVNCLSVASTCWGLRSACTSHHVAIGLRLHFAKLRWLTFQVAELTLFSDNLLCDWL